MTWVRHGALLCHMTQFLIFFLTQVQNYHLYLKKQNTGNEIHSLINMYYKYVFMQIFKYNSNVICTDWEINHPPIFIRSFIYFSYYCVFVCLCWHI